MNYQQYKNSKFVIKLLKQIIKNNLNYDQSIMYQNSDRLCTYNELIAGNYGACLMGWIVSTDYAKQNGISTYETTRIPSYKNVEGIRAVEEFTGIYNLSPILCGGSQSDMHDAKQALKFFKKEFENNLKLALDTKL